MFGVLAINKPAGCTSRDVCNRVERLARPDKVGHTGTLDPMATGVLLLAIGSAVRLVEFSLGHSKTYEADFEFGFSSDTLDVEGVVATLCAPPVPSLQALQEEIGKWIGDVQQVPPKYSAINVAGRRAYDMARKGQSFDLPARQISIESIDLLAYAYPRWTLRIACGSGTYVRSLGSDIAQGLNTDAIMSRLVRTRVGPFQLGDCIDLYKLSSTADIQAALSPPQQLIANVPSIELTDEQAMQIRHGIPLHLQTSHAGKSLSPDLLRLPDSKPERLFAVDRADNLVAVLTQADSTNRTGLYRSLRVFHEASETIQPKQISTQHNPES